MQGLLFLSALCSGLGIAFFCWLYQIPAPGHAVVLLWLLAVAPLAYALRRPVMSHLMALLLLLWAAMFTFRAATFGMFLDRIALLPAVLGAAGVLVFAFGGLHYAVASLSTLARSLRLAGLFAAILSLLLVTTPTLAEHNLSTSGFQNLDASFDISFCLVLVVALGAALTLLNMSLRDRAPKLTRAEGPISLGMLALILAYAFMPLPARYLAGAMSALLLVALLIVLFIAYGRRDRRLADLAGLGLLGLVLIRYCVWFWAPLGFFSFAAWGLLILGLLALVLLMKRKDLSPA